MSLQVGVLEADAIVCGVFVMHRRLCQNDQCSAAHCSRRLLVHMGERAAAAASCRVLCAELPTKAHKKGCARPKSCEKTACKQPDSLPHHWRTTVCTPIVQRSQKSTLTQLHTAGNNAAASRKTNRQESPRHSWQHNAASSRKTDKQASPRDKTGRPPAPRGSRERLRAI